MEANARLERPGVVTSALFKIGEQTFGQVPVTRSVSPGPWTSL